VSDPAASSFEWSALAARWTGEARSAALDAQALRAHVTREMQRARAWLVVELLLTGLVLGGGAWALAFHRSAFTLLLTADAWVVLAVVWGFAVWTRRGTWRIVGERTETYRLLALRFARARVATAWLVLALLALQLGIVTAAPGAVHAGWHATAAARSAAGVVAIIYLLWAVWLRRRALREIRRLG